MTVPGALGIGANGTVGSEFGARLMRPVKTCKHLPYAGSAKALTFPRQRFMGGCLCAHEHNGASPVNHQSMAAVGRLAGSFNRGHALTGAVVRLPRHALSLGWLFHDIPSRGTQAGGVAAFQAPRAVRPQPRATTWGYGKPPPTSLKGRVNRLLPSHQPISGCIWDFLRSTVAG